jgi:Ca2+-transporting ATPase
LALKKYPFHLLDESCEMSLPVIADGGPATPSAKAARQTIDQVAADFNTDLENGLQQTQIESLLGLHGPNDFDKMEEESMFVKFYKSFAENPLILLLLGSAVVSLLMRQMDDAISITLVKSLRFCTFLKLGI